MNLSKTMPDIPDDWKGNVTDTCRVLGGEKPISVTTLKKYAAIGRRHGGIDYNVNRKGLMVFIGKEVKRFWREH